MSLLFSKVELSVENGDVCDFFVCGIPHEKTDLEEYTGYQEFIALHLHTYELHADIKSYAYGDGEIVDAHIYELAALIQRGSRLWNSPNLKLVGITAFDVRLT